MYMWFAYTINKVLDNIYVVCLLILEYIIYTICGMHINIKMVS